MRYTLFCLFVASTLIVQLDADTSTAKTKPQAAPAGKLVKVELIGTDQMRYNKSQIKVPKGATVHLTLTHGGKLPVNIMGHNFVLLKKGVNVSAFAMKAMSAKATNYVHPDQKGQVIAQTGLVGGGKSTTIRFTAPEAGTYDFICTFPGHFACSYSLSDCFFSLE